MEHLKVSFTELEQTVKECRLLVENLHSAWKNVLPDQLYLKMMGESVIILCTMKCNDTNLTFSFAGGIINAWLEELMTVYSSAGTIPGNIDRDIKVLYRVVADCALTVLEVRVQPFFSQFFILPAGRDP